MVKKQTKMNSTVAEEKKIDILLNELDDIVEAKLLCITSQQAHNKNKYSNASQNTFLELEKDRTNRVTEAKKDVYLKLNDISNYISSDMTDKDYEKIAKIIAHTHDIVTYIDSKHSSSILEEALLKVSNDICNYFIPFKNFKSIQKNKVEGSYVFDGDGSFVNYNGLITGRTVVQATKHPDPLEQTELIFQTSEKQKTKKIYIISSIYPKENLHYYFKNVDDELYEKLEELRFLVLSSKIYQTKVITSNKSLEYFFSIIYFSSKGFDNLFNRNMYNIYYDGDFDILNLMENYCEKNNKNTIINGVNSYLEKTFKYFNDNLNMIYFKKDGFISEPMKEIIHHLNLLTTYHVQTNQERNKLITNLANINISKKTYDNPFTSWNIPHYSDFLSFYKKLSLNHFNYKYSILKLQKNINTKKTINHNFDYHFFVQTLKKILIEELQLEKTKLDEHSFSKLTDEDILNIAFFNNGQNFINLMYQFKNKKEKEYENIKQFKKFMIAKLIIIFDNLEKNHLKILYDIIFSTIFVTKGVQSLLFDACTEIFLGNVSVEYINNFKIFLLSTIFYPQILKNDNYYHITEFILKNSINYKLLFEESLYEDIINIYDKHRKILNPIEFIKNLNLSPYDLLQLLKILQIKNQDYTLVAYIKHILQEFLLDDRLNFIRSRSLARSTYQNFQLHKVFPNSNSLSLSHYERYMDEMIDLKFLFFELIDNNQKDNKLIAIFRLELDKKPINCHIYYSNPNQIYSQDQLYNIFEMVFYQEI